MALLILAGFWAYPASAQIYPSPTFNVLTLTTPLGNASGGTGTILPVIPHVANLSALELASSTNISQIIRDGYAIAGDSGAPITYSYSAISCPLNGGAGDNGWQVQASNGGCWVAELPTSGADIRIWGAVTGAGSDAAVLAAVNAASQGQAGGKVLIPASYFKVAQSANLDLRAYPHVTIACAAGTGIGVQPTGQSNLTAPCTLQLNPPYTILPGPNFEMSGVRLINQNVEIATAVRAAITAVNAFAGTALTITQNDQLIQHVQINGFSQAIKTISPFNYTGSGATQIYHVRLSDIQGDDTNFISIGDCGDACMINHADAWNFITAAGAATYTITGVSVHGGDNAYQIAVDSEGVPLVSGDTIEVYGISGGTNMPLGRYTVGTIIDATDFTLAGTNASGAIYGSGGSVAMPTGIRKGIAYEFTGTNIGGQFGYSLWEYGHDTAVHMGPKHGPINLYGVWTDGPPYLTDPTPIGIWNEGIGGNVFGGELLNKAKTIYNNAPDAIVWLRPLTISGTVIQASGCQSESGDGSALTLLAGAVVIDSSFVTPSCPSGTYPGYNEFSVTAGATLKIATTNLNSATFGYVAAPAWVSGTAYTVTPQSYVTNGSGNTYKAAAAGTSGTTGLNAAGTVAGTLYNDNGGSGGLNWTYVGPGCLSVTVDGASPSCTPPATTTVCSAGQQSWDTASFYFCTPNNSWGAVVTANVTTGQVQIVPPGTLSAGLSTLVVKGNDGSGSGFGGQVTLADNFGSAVNATKFLRVAASNGAFQIINAQGIGIFSMTNQGGLSNVPSMSSPWGFNLSAVGTAVSAWVTNTAYTNLSYSTSNGNIYHVYGGACTSGATPPSGTTTSNDGACKWEYVSGVPTGNIELHALSTGAVTACAGNTSTQKGLYIQNGSVTPGACDGTGSVSGGVALGTTTFPFAGVATTELDFASLSASKTAPTISSGFCTGSNVAFNNGTSAFQVGVGSSACTGIKTGVIGLPTAAHGWSCNVHNVTSAAANNPEQTGTSASSSTFTNYSRTTGLAADWTASDSLTIDCFAY
jgi:hypothetical protein